MKLSKVLFLSAIVLGMVFANPVWAMTTPGIALVSVQCEQPQSQIFTVRVKFDAFASGLVFEFRNVSTGQAIIYNSLINNGVDIPFPVPQGTYNLTVKQNSGQHSQSLWTNIVVPPTVSTPGQGTGCRFLNIGETPASVSVPSRR